MENLQNIAAVDLFCGIGGLAFGLHQSGIRIKAGIDIDESCRFAFEENCCAEFICESVSDLDPKKIKSFYKTNEIKVLVGCAPCQPFSNYTVKADKKKDNRWQLLNDFSRIINEVQPEIISMENIPQLVSFKQAPVFQNFIKNLKKNKYFVWYGIIYAPDYGIPQKRKRLVLLASKLGEISILKPTHTPDKYITVRNVIEHLDKIKAGESSENDFFHRSSSLNEKNLKRIIQSKPGGSWIKDWDHDLVLECHKQEKRKSYGSIYGRMEWDEPSPTMTTFCTGIGNGRFGHPEQNRAISLREAALLQTFPQEYRFVKNFESLKVRSLSKHIGNAVPPRLGMIIGESIVQHIKNIKNGKE